MSIDEIPDEVITFLKSGANYEDADCNYYFMPLVFKFDKDDNYEIISESSKVPMLAKYKFKKLINKILNFDLENN